MDVIHHGDSLEVLRGLPDECAQCCITSPPYWGLRDYGCAGQLGLEPTPEQYVAKMVAIFAEVRRVLRPDGTLWLNLGDSYAATIKGSGGITNSTLNAKRDETGNLAKNRKSQPAMPGGNRLFDLELCNLKPKDLIGIPWRVAFALQQDGWYLRSDIIWSKPNPMPESVTDRPTKAHEYVFLMSKSSRYYYDQEAVLDAATTPEHIASRWISGTNRPRFDDAQMGTVPSGGVALIAKGKRNRRTVWTIPTHPYPEAHFAVFPETLVEPCLMAGSAEGDTVLDPFMGSGTVAKVALRARRHYIGIELNEDYIRLAEKRLAPLKAQEVLAL